MGKRNRKQKRASKLRRQRTLRTETLESRQLLSADGLVPGHNYWIANDANNDLKVNATDALVVINNLEATSAAGEVPGMSKGYFLDTNADGQVTAIDALRVLNAINSGEGASNELLELQLDVTQNGTSIVDENRLFTVGVGEKFDLEVEYNDLRGPFERLGVFSLYADIIASDTSAFRPVLSETQIITISENLVDATGGSVSLTSAGSNITATIPLFSTNPNIPNLAQSPTLAIQQALEQDFGYGAGNIGVTEGIRQPRVGTTPGDDFTYIVRFLGDNDEFRDQPQLSVNAGGLSGAFVTTSVSEIPVFSDPAQTVINPDAFLANVDFRSRDLNNAVVYGNVRSGSLNVGSNETFDEVGGTGPVDPGGLRPFATANGTNFTGVDFEAFSIELQAVAPVNGLQFTLDLPDATGSEISLYGRDEVLDGSLILIDLEDDASIAGDDRFGLVIGTVTDTSSSAITAATDIVSVAEDASATIVDVLANDTTTAGLPLAVTGVSAAQNGTASFANGVVTYAPGADFFGTDTFTYTVSDGTNTTTGVVNVTVTSVNDPPMGQDITVNVAVGGTLPISFSSFLLAQPANENDVISVTQAVASQGNVSIGSGNLIYTAPSSATTDTIVVTFNDGQANGTANITVNVTTSGAPVANDDTISVTEDTVATLSIQASLLNNDVVSAGTPTLTNLNSANTLGDVVLNGDGTFTYTPPLNLSGNAVDSFRYLMTDGAEVSNEAVVTINIIAVNDNPVANNITRSANGGAITIPIADLGNGGPGEPLDTIQITNLGPTNQGGSVSVSPGGQSLVYTPVSTFTGTETFTFTITDQGSLSDSGIVTVNNTGSGGGTGTASLSGIKFEDANENGVQDAGEAGLPGWVIFIDVNGDGALTAGEPSTVTDANGQYTFSNLAAGTYTIREQQQAGFRQTLPAPATTSQSRTFQTGTFTGFTTIADVDGDGDNDIVVANEYSNAALFQSSVTVLTNDGAGGFTESTLALPNNARPQAVFVSDLTGDNIPDLAVASAGTPFFPGAETNGVHIFTGLGIGFGATPSFIQAGDGPSDITGADLNGDGNVDLITANHRSNDISVLLGQGGGAFAAATNIPVGDRPIALATADVNGDGNLDLAVANYGSASISVLTGTGGSFTAIAPVTGVSFPTDILLQDLDGNGTVDLLATDSENETLRSFSGNGSGAFTADTTTQLTGAPESISLGDFNGDGNHDVLIANRDAVVTNRESGASVALGDGAGNFANAPEALVGLIPSFDSGGQLPKSVAMAQLDNDGTQDFVLAFATGGVSVSTSGATTSAPGAYVRTLADGQAVSNLDFGNFQFATQTSASVTLTTAPTSISETGGVGTVTATLSEVLAQDVIVTLGASGSATLNGDYTLSATQIVIPAGSTTGTTTISSVPDSAVEANETVIIDVTSVAGAIENGVQQVTTVINDDDTVAVTVSLTATPLTLTEGGTAGSLTATLSSVAAQDVVVNLAYAGSATAGTDYTAPTSITVPAGQTSASALVQTIDDFLEESSESIVASISSVTGATENGAQTASISITDNDGPPPTVALSTSTTSIAEAGGSTSVVATLSGPAPQDVVVSLGYSGDAALGADFTAPTQINIPAGSLSGSVILQALTDTVDEPDETLTVTISGVVGATTPTVQTANVTILDDDAPTASLLVDFSQISEDGGVAQIFANLTSTVSTPTTVNLEFSGSAVLGTDYITTGTVIVIPANASSASISIQAINNQVIEEADRVVDINIVGSTTGGTSVTIVNEDGVSFPLRSVGTPMEGFGQEVTSADLNALYAASIDIWAAAGLSDVGLATLRDVDLAISDLDGDLIGLAEHDMITIDVDANSFGWFVDSTPESDSEFHEVYFSDVDVTMDLLTVLLHEQGHILGLEDDTSELMLERLAAGSRRMPSPADIDNALDQLLF